MITVFGQRKSKKFFFEYLKFRDYPLDKLP